jgi:hypothetical protein
LTDREESRGEDKRPEIIPFRTRADRFQHGNPYPKTELVQTVTCMETDAGISGYYLRQTCDRPDPDGFITLPTTPGLGYDIVWDYIHENSLLPERLTPPAAR